MIEFPLPGSAPYAVAAPAPRPGHRCWAGAPSAAHDGDGGYLVAYRVRVAADGIATIVLARSDDGEQLETITEIDRTHFGAHSVERPALIRTPGGRWRLYVCCASPQWPDSKHWWIDVLEADRPEDLGTATPRTVFPGDERTGVKDPVIRCDDGRWQAWICCHPLDQRDEEDRMTTAYATSDDGLTWRWHGTALTGRPGTWDSRGARVTAVLANGWATYDGRASKEENFSERTGVARLGTGPGRLVQAADTPVADVRYLDALPLPGGGHRIYYEAPLPDGSHELRTEHIPR